jgi:hypothetical protein
MPGVEISRAFFFKDTAQERVDRQNDLLSLERITQGSGLTGVEVRLEIQH